MNCYLLERPHDNGMPTYLCSMRIGKRGKADYLLSVNPYDAIRFCRREDAERVLEGTDLRAVEHVFQ